MSEKDLAQRKSGVATLSTIVAALLLSGCVGLPSSGPTGYDVRRAAEGKKGEFSYQLVDVRSLADLPLPPARATPTIAEIEQQPTDILGPGDVLNISVYEVGVKLFGNVGRGIGSPAAGGFDPSSSAERLPPTRVDDYGFIRVPYVGRLQVAGRSVAEVQQMIQDGLQGMTQAPQVLVNVQESITNSVILSGEVSRPGRLVLPTNRETLAEAIALAGGYRGAAKDAVVRIRRGDQAYEVRVSDLLEAPDTDIRVAPGDRITVVNRPQTFSVLGAANRADEIVFPRTPLSLAQAVALSGGSNPQQGDAAAVFVFRFVRQADGTERPTVYQLNMMRPGAYLLAQKFLMRDRDVLFVGNARANQLTKFVQLISQLFIPVVTVQTTVANATE